MYTFPHFTAPLAIVTFGQSQFQVFYNLIDTATLRRALRQDPPLRLSSEFAR